MSEIVAFPAGKLEDRQIKPGIENVGRSGGVPGGEEGYGNVFGIRFKEENRIGIDLKLSFFSAGVRPGGMGLPN